MIAMAKEDLARHESWVENTENRLKEAEDRLDRDFEKLL